MAMNMSRAFNARMLSVHTKHTVGAGSYNDDNDWVEGTLTSSELWGVNRSGNKFSQFEEGVARKSTDGGVRFSNYRTLYIDLTKYTLEVDDKVEYIGKYYNVLQMSPEDTFGFRSFLLEEVEDWTP